MKVTGLVASDRCLNCWSQLFSAGAGAKERSREEMRGGELGGESGSVVHLIRASACICQCFRPGRGWVSLWGVRGPWEGESRDPVGANPLVMTR